MLFDRKVGFASNYLPALILQFNVWDARHPSSFVSLYFFSLLPFVKSHVFCFSYLITFGGLVHIVMGANKAPSAAASTTSSPFVLALKAHFNGTILDLQWHSLCNKVWIVMPFWLWQSAKTILRSPGRSMTQEPSAALVCAKPSPSSLLARTMKRWWWAKTTNEAEVRHRIFSSINCFN